MKPLLMIIAFAFIISSCNNEAKNKLASSETKTTIDTTIPFGGTWASVKYIDTLLKTKSPSRSQDEGFFLHIPDSYKDVAYPYLYHEAAPNYHVIKHGDSYYFKGVDNPNDTALIKMIDNGNKLIYAKDTFVLVDDDDGVPEDLLFCGNYDYNDKPVYFDGDGTIKGLDSIKYYSIENDYIGPGGGDLDIIYLGSNEKEKRTHAFKFVGDTLLVYDIKCLEKDNNGDCLDIEKGKLKYKLVKESNPKGED